MAVTQNTYTGDGTTVLFSFTFPYLETTDIKVSLNGTITTAYTLANATTIQFNTAPANGAAIRIYRVTDDAALAAQFYPGSAIRSQDLNDNFTQNLYVTQESNRDATSAITTANSALTASASATSTSNTALSQSSTALSNSAAAVSTANTASSNATTALSQSSAAVTTANSSQATATSAAADAASALSASATASSNASTALSQSNTALSNSSTALSQSSTALSNSASAVTTAGTASSNASTALSTANTAISTANAAASAVANAILYDLVANVAAIPGSPSNNDAVEVVDSTGIESFTPLAGKPVGFTGSSGLSVRIVYTTTGATWNWIQYFPNDPETRYLKTGTGTITSTNIADGTIVNADISATAAIAPSKISGTAVVDNDARLTDARTPTDGSVTNTKVNASAAIDGTKISPNFGSQNVTTTGTATAAALIPSGSSVPTNGVYLPSVNNVAISTNGVQRINIEADGDINIDSGGVFYDATNNRLGIGTTSPATDFVCFKAGVGLEIDTSGGFAGRANTATVRAFDRPNIAYKDLGITGGNVLFGINDQEAARIDSSKRLLVGTSSSYSGFTKAIEIAGTTSTDQPVVAAFNFNNSTADQAGYFNLFRSRGASVGTNTIVQNGDYLGYIQFLGANGSGYSTAASIRGEVDGTPGASNDMPGRLVFSTTADGASSPTERMRIVNNGDVLIGGTGTAGLFTVLHASGKNGISTVVPANDTGTKCFLAYSTTTNSDRFIVYANGNVVNANNSYGSISDAKLKENIVDAGSQWDDLKRLQVRKYNFKEGQTHTQIGLIAQEVELVSPGLVIESPDTNREGNNLGTTTKSVNYSVLYMKAVKALQEAMERIEALEAKVATLEAV